MKLREQLEKIRFRKFKAVRVEDQTFTVRQLSAAEAVAYHAYTKAEPQPSFLDCMTRLVAACLIDDGADAASTPEDAAHLQRELDQLPYAVLSALFRACTELNRLDDAAVESAEKNSGTVT